MVGRSHNVAAQATTLGKRFATAGEELLVAVDRVDELLARYPLRGVTGPMGTAQDQLDLLGGDPDKLAALQDAVARHLGFDRALASTGQIYPRSLDLDVVVRPGPGRRRPGRRWPPRCGSWPATSWSPKGSPPARWARRPCPTR